MNVFNDQDKEEGSNLAPKLKLSSTQINIGTNNKNIQKWMNTEIEEVSSSSEAGSDHTQ